MNSTRPSQKQSSTKSSSARLRAAWLYHHHQLTQTEVARRLGLSRATVVRMLDEAHKRNEVQVWIKDEVGECIELAIALEDAFGLSCALVAPGSDNPTSAVAALLGQFLSQNIEDGMTIGIGWGRTLTSALDYFVPDHLPAAKVVSLMGGLINPARKTPIEVSWRLASMIGAECYLYPAPIIVDSADTKRTLLEDCGLSQIGELAGSLDMSVVSCGEVGPQSTSLARDMVDSTIYSQLQEAGAVCDIMCNFIDQNGRSVAHPIGQRTMSVDLDRVATSDNVVLASGGIHRAKAILASLRRLAPKTLITDEETAGSLLDLVRSEQI